MKTNFQKLKVWLKSQDRVNETFVTTDYSIFKRLNGNRTLNLVHVKRLEDSIQKNGMLQVDVIINEFGEVIDGQNRLEAAKNTESSVFFKVCEGYGLREAQILNENVKAWRKIDYLDSYCELGYEPYLKFKKFMSDFPELNFLSLESIFLLRSSTRYDKVGGVGVTSKYFETGKLSIVDLEKSYRFASQIMDIKPYFEGFNNSVFVRAMLAIFRNDNYEHDEFIKKLQNRTAPSLDLCHNIEQYKLLIEEIYNYKRSGKVNLRY